MDISISKHNFFFGIPDESEKFERFGEYVEEFDTPGDYTYDEHFVQINDCYKHLVCGMTRECESKKSYYHIDPYSNSTIKLEKLKGIEDIIGPKIFKVEGTLSTGPNDGDSPFNDKGSINLRQYSFEITNLNEIYFNI